MKVSIVLTQEIRLTSPFPRRLQSRAAAMVPSTPFIRTYPLSKLSTTIKLIFCWYVGTSKLYATKEICSAWPCPTSTSSSGNFGSRYALFCWFFDHTLSCCMRTRVLVTCHLYRYYTGVKKAPILTIVIGGNHEASSYFWELWVRVRIMIMSVLNHLLCMQIPRWLDCTEYLLPRACWLCASQWNSDSRRLWHL